MKERISHLVVRFSDNLFSVGDVVTKHNEVVLKEGYVWFGKLGSPISVSRIDILNSQVEKAIPTYLYLIKGNRKKSTPYRALLLKIAKNLPEFELKKFPFYYSEKGILQYIKTWIKLGEILPIDMSVLSGLRVHNSVFTIQETLALSSSGHFLVHEVIIPF